MIQLKQQIIDIIRYEGPVLPVAISRKLGSDTYFAGAVLSELVKSKSVKITSAKIGSSPLYYISGQESKLHKLYDYLPGKEKEAYELLRTHQVLKDAECEPAIRVALRSIKDFAFPLEINSELYWRWHLTNEQEALKIIQPEVSFSVQIESSLQKQLPLDVREKPELQKKTIKEPRDDEFLSLVLDSLKKKNITILESQLLRKNREIFGKIQINSDLGILPFCFVAKNKKNITEADLSLAHDVGRKHKLSVLFLTTGVLSKKAEKYLEEHLKGNLVLRKI